MERLAQDALQRAALDGLVGDVVVGHATLEDGLHACDVTVQSSEIAPPRVVRIELRRGVEQPARPRRILRGKHRAVDEVGLAGVQPPGRGDDRQPASGRESVLYGISISTQ